MGDEALNRLIAAPRDCCRPIPLCQEEFLEVVNFRGERDRLLLFHISCSVDRVIQTENERTYLRIADSTKEVLGENLRNLEYSKGSRHYEDELHPTAQISDLDEELLDRYKQCVRAEHSSYEDVLRARGFVVERNGVKYLKNSAVLLFANNVRQFYPNCRIRFVRYEGNSARTGTQINIIRDQSIEYPLLRIIEKAQEFISTQLREFTVLDTQTGRFKTVPEYPEFAWLEGIVNAVTHREYSLAGSFIKVSMYDDRLEIESPGRFPGLVTVENIRETRYSRNPDISRVLTEFGWVKELNEGVKRIYSDMKGFLLDEPTYKETANSVCLVLKNNIAVRQLRQNGKIIDAISSEAWEKLDGVDRQILTYIGWRGAVRRDELERYLGKSHEAVRRRLNFLLTAGVIRRNGNKYDRNHTYEILLRSNDG